MDSLLVNLGCGHAWHPAWRNYDLSPTDPAVHPLDLTQPLPLANASVDAVYHAHVLEHFNPPDARHFLAECHRVLKPQGLLRVVVPDLELHAREYLAALESGDVLRHDWGTLQLVDQMVRTRSEGAMGEFLRQRPWRDHPEVARWLSTETGTAPGKAPRQFWSRVRFALAKWLLTPRERVLLQEARFRATGEIHRWMYDRASLARLLGELDFRDVTVRTATTSRLPEFARYGLDATTAGVIRHPDSLYVEAVKG